MSHTTESPTGAGEMGRRSTPMSDASSQTCRGCGQSAPAFLEGAPLSKADRDALMRKMWPTMASAQEIANACGMLRNTVLSRAHRLGLGGRPWIKHGPSQSAYVLSDKEVAIATEMRAAGHNLGEVGARLGLKKTTLNRAIYRANLHHLLARLPAASTRAKLGYPTKWSPERIALMREILPQGASLREAVRRLNELPGRPMKAHSTVALFAKEMGIPRIDGRVFSVPPPPAAIPVWSAERDALLEQGWPAGMSLAALAEQVNLLPGPPVTARGVENRVRRCHLLRAVKIKRVVVKPPAMPKPALPQARPASWNRAPAPEKQPTGRIGGYRFDKPVDAIQPRNQPPTEPIVLPPPAADGRIEMQLLPLMWWCRQNEIHGFDGAQMAQLNALMDKRKRPHFVVVG